MESSFDYLRAHAVELGSRILETYPPLQSTKDAVSPSLAALSRKALPAQALAITGTAKYLRRAKAARIVAECGAGKTFMALGTIHVLAEGRPSATLVMCPSHITHKWAREVLMTIPRARAFLIEDMRNGGAPGKPHGVCEVKLSKGKTVYEGKRLSLAEMRRMGRKEWRKRFPGPTFFITGKDKGKLGYFWEHVYLKAKSGPNLGGVINPDSGVAILDSEMQKLTALDFTDKLKVSEALTAPCGGTTRFLSGKQLSLFGQGQGEIRAGGELTPGPVDSSQVLYDIGDAPPCVACGGLLRPNGTCYTCVNCGQTGGCW